MRLIIIILSTLMFPSMALADTAGPARVVDGDTIWIRDTKIRLHGIDAPETKQFCTSRKGKVAQCGRLATQALVNLVKGQTVTCKGNERDRYGRLIATCYAGPFNINEQMVLDGWALAYRKYSKSYVRAENFAKARKEGMWRMEFVPPWEWRRK